MNAESANTGTAQSSFDVHAVLIGNESSRFRSSPQPPVIGCTRNSRVRIALHGQ
jgi:hypothetical protein